MIRNITRIIVHCSATKPDNNNVNAESIRRYHMDINGWSDIGYHNVILRNGTVQDGRPINRQGAHAKDHNHDSIGICLVGGIDKNGKPDFNYTRSQLESLQWVIDDFMDVYGKLEVLGHRDLPGVAKACPCFDVNAWWSNGVK